MAFIRRMRARLFRGEGRAAADAPFFETRAAAPPAFSAKEEAESLARWQSARKRREMPEAPSARELSTVGALAAALVGLTTAERIVGPAEQGGAPTAPDGDSAGRLARFLADMKALVGDFAWPGRADAGAVASGPPGAQAEAPVRAGSGSADVQHRTGPEGSGLDPIPPTVSAAAVQQPAAAEGLAVGAGGTERVPVMRVEDALADLDVPRAADSPRNTAAAERTAAPEPEPGAQQVAAREPAARADQAFDPIVWQSGPVASGTTDSRRSEPAIAEAPAAGMAGDAAKAPVVAKVAEAIAKVVDDVADTPPAAGEIIKEPATPAPVVVARDDDNRVEPVRFAVGRDDDEVATVKPPSGVALGRDEDEVAVVKPPSGLALGRDDDDNEDERITERPGGVAVRRDDDDERLVERPSGLALGRDGDDDDERLVERPGGLALGRDDDGDDERLVERPSGLALGRDDADDDDDDERIAERPSGLALGRDDADDDDDDERIAERPSGLALGREDEDDDDGERIVERPSGLALGRDDADDDDDDERIAERPSGVALGRDDDDDDDERIAERPSGLALGRDDDGDDNRVTERPSRRGRDDDDDDDGFALASFLRTLEPAGREAASGRGGDADDEPPLPSFLEARVGGQPLDSLI